MSIFSDDVGRSWEKFGSQDPYFGVLNRPHFRAAAKAGAAREEFFETGRRHMDHVFAVMRGCVSRDFAPKRAVDFGCGVGRLVIPLARVVPEVIGVDISSSMLAEARRNCEQEGLSNVQFVRSEAAFAGVEGTFDFIHSYIVFQHIPFAQGKAILQRILAQLQPSGFGALHFVYGSDWPAWRRAIHTVRKHVPLAHQMGNLLQRQRFSAPLMQMNPYPLDWLLGTLQSNNCHTVCLRFSNHGGWRGAFLLFQKVQGQDLG